MPAKATGSRTAKGKPPVPLIKFGNGSRIKERQLMKFRKRVRNVIVIPVNLADPIHVPHLNSNSSLAFSTRPRIIFRASP